MKQQAGRGKGRESESEDAEEEEEEEEEEKQGVHWATNHFATSSFVTQKQMVSKSSWSLSRKLVVRKWECIRLRKIFNATLIIAKTNNLQLPQLSPVNLMQI